MMQKIEDLVFNEKMKKQEQEGARIMQLNIDKVATWNQDEGQRKSNFHQKKTDRLLRAKEITSVQEEQKINRIT
jgi:hypothetical protein